VQQAIDTAKIDECAEVCDIFDNTLANYNVPASGSLLRPREQQVPTDASPSSTVAGRRKTVPSPTARLSEEMPALIFAQNPCRCFRFSTSSAAVTSPKHDRQ